MDKILSQHELPQRIIKTMIRSGDINYQRRKSGNKQVVLSSQNGNPFKALSTIKYLFKKYEKPSQEHGSKRVSEHKASI